MRIACFLYGIYKESEWKFPKIAFLPVKKREIFLDKKVILWYTV